MARYFNVRGFLDCEHADLSTIRDIISSHQPDDIGYGLDADTINLYTAGWVYHTREINWSAHAFFGASMRSGGLNLILSQLRSIALTLPEVTGLFFIDDDEESESFSWKIVGGVVTLLPAQL